MSDQQTLAMLESRDRGRHPQARLRDPSKPATASRSPRQRLPSWYASPRIEQARQFAAAVGGKTSIATFADRQELWTRGGALETEVLEKNDTRYRFNVTRCKYAEMYRDMGLADRPPAVLPARRHLLRGLRQAPQAQAHADHHAGATHCDFDYTYDEGRQGVRPKFLLPAAIASSPACSNTPAAPRPSPASASSVSPSAPPVPLVQGFERVAARHRGAGSAAHGLLRLRAAVARTLHRCRLPGLQ